MDQFFKGLNLSNILRQLLCGVVFFIPFLIFGREEISALLCDGILENAWLPLLLIATCIGTIIYHVEKNLLGYASQIFRAWCKKKAPTLPPIIALAIMLLVGTWLIFRLLNHIITINWVYYAIWALSIGIPILCSLRFNCLEKKSKYVNRWTKKVIDYLKKIVIKNESKDEKKSTGLILAFFVVALCCVCLLGTWVLSCEFVKNILNFNTLMTLLIYTALFFLPMFVIFPAINAKHTESGNEKLENADSQNKQEKAFDPDTTAFDLVIDETRDAWAAASVDSSDLRVLLEDKENTPEILKKYLKDLTIYHEIQAIAKRESGWADFIHCGQTSAIAWIFGSFTAFHTCTPCDTYPNHFIIGILLAIWLLSFEFFCEWHKSLHLDDMIKKYNSITNQTPNS